MQKSVLLEKKNKTTIRIEMKNNNKIENKTNIEHIN